MAVLFGNGVEVAREYVRLAGWRFVELGATALDDGIWRSVDGGIADLASGVDGVAGLASDFDGFAGLASDVDGAGFWRM